MLPRVFYKAIFILSIPLMAEILVGCCNCPEPEYFSYSNCAVYTTLLDNSSQYPAEIQAGSVAREAFGLRVHITRAEQMCLTPHAGHIGFVGSAHALSCPCDPPITYAPTDRIDHLRVLALNDFNEMNPSGSDVTEYFRFISHSEMQSVPEYLYSRSDTLYGGSIRPLEFDIFLMTPPQDTGTYRFQIEVELSDDRVLQTKTDSVRLI